MLVKMLKNHQGFIIEGTAYCIAAVRREIEVVESGLPAKRVTMVHEIPQLFEIPDTVRARLDLRPFIEQGVAEIIDEEPAV